VARGDAPVVAGDDAECAHAEAVTSMARSAMRDDEVITVVVLGR
jgi:hypothetical protein